MITPSTTKEFIPYASRKQIAFVGDSLTLGNWSLTTGGYRSTLLAQLAAVQPGGYYPNVVGADFTSYSYPMIGYSAMRTDQILDLYVTPQLAAIPSITMPIAPDVVFLVASGNDLLQGRSQALAMADLSSIIDAFRNAKSTCHVFVGSLIDMDLNTANMQNWSAAIQAMVQARGDYNTQVHFVDLFSALGFYTPTLWADDKHPNTAGYAILGNAWYAAYDLIF